ncbi:hypothetical protein [Neorhizobium sp. DT-125]|uniref:4Fe-4S dicluster domain-containing protein n=1 Tax=Neorhizobium sp. DT-125 TaxID=3396163 RepID=UPI003F53F27F
MTLAAVAVSPFVGEPEARGMTYVVTENCINCKYTDFVAVFPVDCFREGPNFLIIHPDDYIVCDACVPVCPAKAIYRDIDLPRIMQPFLGLNEELSRLAEYHGSVRAGSDAPDPLEGEGAVELSRGLHLSDKSIARLLLQDRDCQTDLHS